MGLVKYVKNIARAIVGKSAGFVPLLSFGGFSNWGKKLSNAEIASLGFRGWQYIAITTIADAFKGLQFRLYNKKWDEIQNEAMDFITPKFLEYIAIFMKMTGTAYVWKMMSWKRCIGLNFLLPQYLHPKIDNNWFLVSWEYYINWKKITFEKEDIIVFANANPNQAYPNITRGYSPIQAIAMTIKGEEAIEDWNHTILTGGDRPWTILTTDREMTLEQVQMVMQKRNENHWWPKNAGKSALLPFGIKPFNVVSSPKEMDFINEKKRDMEKILAVYKVPKAIIGMWEGVNVGNVNAFNRIFAERTIKPLAMEVAKIITASLFAGVGEFEFINVLPADEEEVRNHYFAGGITRNEYREAIWYNKVKWWDVFIDWNSADKEEEKQETGKEVSQKTLHTDIKINKNSIKNIILQNTKGTDEYMQKKREAKIKRMDKYEKKIAEWLKRIFAKQESDILKKFDEKYKNDDKKGIKVEKWVNLALAVKYHALYTLLLKEPITDLVKKEWDVAMGALSVDIAFNESSPEVKKAIKKKIGVLAKSVDKITDEKIQNAIKMGIDWGLLPSEIKWELKKVFKELSTTRAETIVRTETIRMGTFAEQKAREQSWVVKGKQWRTALDERTCEYCNSMHGKKIWLQENFFKKWDRLGTLKLDYEDVIGSPLHPRCRCDMIPIEE